jgi:broad specificity phosphatase PhoE
VSVTVVYETHSTTEDNEAGIATGWLPGRLSPTGKAQAVALGERRRNDGLSVVFTSDLARAVDTAEIAFAGSSLPRIADERLRECDYGEQNGTPLPVDGDRLARVDSPYPGGESWRQACERVAAFYEELRRSRDGERVLVIGHAATRWALEILVNARTIEEMVGEEFVWQPGWEYVL